MADETPEQTIARLTRELDDNREVGAEIEKELTASLEERDRELQAANAKIAALEEAQKKSNLTVNDLRADLDEAASKVTSAESDAAEAKNQRREAQRELERLERWQRQHEFTVRKLEAESQRAVEEAIVKDTTIDDLNRRVKELEGTVMHRTAERDEARSSAAAAAAAAAAATPPETSSKDNDGAKAEAAGASTSEPAATAPAVTADGDGRRTPPSQSTVTGESESGTANMVLSAEMRDVLMSLRALALDCRNSRANLSTPDRKAVTASAN